MSKKWHIIDTSKPLQSDIDTETYGGVEVAHNVDLKHKKGSVYARQADTTSILPPSSPYNVAHEIEFGKDSLNDSDLSAIVTRSSIDRSTSINGIAVRGFKNVSGLPMQGNYGLHGGWIFPSGLQPDANQKRGNIEIRDNELRYHGESPKWFGIPKSVTEQVTDFSYVHGIGGQLLNPGINFTLSEPFGTDNLLSPPSANDFRVEFNMRRNRLGNSISFDDVPFWGPPNGRNSDGREPGRFEYAYFAVSYLYDGYQESPLTVLPQVVELTNYYDPFPTIRSGGCRSIFVDLFMPNIAPPSRRATSARVRKIRVYCAPSVGRLSHPLRSGTFYLASEIDVSEWDSKSTIGRYSLPVFNIGDCGELDFTEIRNSAHLNDRNLAFECDVDVGFADIGDVFGNDDSRATTRRYFEFEEGAPWFRLNENDTAYRCKAIGIYRPNPNDPNDRVLVVFSHEDDLASLTTESLNSGGKPTINISHAFRTTNGDSTIGLKHRIYLGDELLGRPTYEELSGLSQAEEIIGPPRKGGYSGFDIPVIWNVRDKDGIWHPERLMWSAYSPSSVVTPDRFPVLNYKDFGFEVISARRSGGYLAVFGSRDLAFGILTRDELQWDFSDSFKHLGCASVQSIVDTPFGLIYLCYDGTIKLLSGNTPVAQFNSDAVREIINKYRTYWEYAVGSYSARHQQYILHFPRGGSLGDYRTIVYDFNLGGWMTCHLMTPTQRVYSANTDNDGDAVFAAESNPEVGYFKYASGEDRYSGYSRVKVSAVLGDVVHKKIMQRFKVIYDEGQDVGLEITVTPESTDSRPSDALHGDIDINSPPSILIKSGARLALEDRRFTIDIRNFEKIGAVFVESDTRTGVDMEARNG